MSWVRFVAWRFFLSRKKDKFVNLTSKISTFSITLAIAMLIVTLAVMRGFEEVILEKALQDQGHIVISNFSAFEPDDVLKSIPKGLSAYSVVETNAVVSTKNMFESVVVRGVHDIKTNKNKKNHVVVGSYFASHLYVIENSNITVMMPFFDEENFEVSTKTIALTLADVVNFKSYDMNRHTIFMKMEDLQHALNLENKVHKIICHASSPKEALKFVSHLKQKLPNFFITTWEDNNRMFADVMRVQRNMVTVILCAIILLATIVCVSSLVLFVNIKKREIAILLSLGASSSKITSVFVLIALIVSFISSVLGGIVGVILAFNLDRIRIWFETFFNISLFNPDVFLLPAIPVSIHSTDVITILCFSFVISFFASIIPAFKSTSINIAENL